MSSAVIYLDESGDLGWAFDKPYRQGGSSRHITICGLLVPSAKTHFPKRVMKRLYDSENWPRTTEMKWGAMAPASRTAFVTRAAALRVQHPDILYLTMTVKKQNVHEHIKRDANKLTTT